MEFCTSAAIISAYNGSRVELSQHLVYLLPARPNIRSWSTPLNLLLLLLLVRLLQRVRWAWLIGVLRRSALRNVSWGTCLEATSTSTPAASTGPTRPSPCAYSSSCCASRDWSVLVSDGQRSGRSVSRTCCPSPPPPPRPSVRPRSRAGDNSGISTVRACARVYVCVCVRACVCAVAAS